jgi:hypothetical protein
VTLWPAFTCPSRKLPSSLYFFYSYGGLRALSVLRGKIKYPAKSAKGAKRRFVRLCASRASFPGGSHGIGPRRGSPFFAFHLTLIDQTKIIDRFFSFSNFDKWLYLNVLRLFFAFLFDFQSKKG